MIAIGDPVEVSSAAAAARKCADRLFATTPLLKSIRIMACAYRESLQTWFEWHGRTGACPDIIEASDILAANAWRFQQSATPLAVLAGDEARRHAAMAQVSAVALTRRATWLAEHVLVFDRPTIDNGTLHPVLISGQPRPDVAAAQFDFYCDR